MKLIEAYNRLKHMVSPYLKKWLLDDIYDNVLFF